MERPSKEWQNGLDKWWEMIASTISLQKPTSDGSLTSAEHPGGVARLRGWSGLWKGLLTKPNAKYLQRRKDFLWIPQGSKREAQLKAQGSPTHPYTRCRHHQIKRGIEGKCKLQIVETLIEGHDAVVKAVNCPAPVQIQSYRPPECRHSWVHIKASHSPSRKGTYSRDCRIWTSWIMNMTYSRSWTLAKTGFWFLNIQVYYLCICIHAQTAIFALSRDK